VRNYEIPTIRCSRCRALRGDAGEGLGGDVSPAVIAAIRLRGGGDATASEGSHVWHATAAIALVIAVAAAIYGSICWESLNNPLNAIGASEVMSQ
jgi:hypothetical protein